MTFSSSGEPIILFLDWDSTLTEKSTLPLIASISTYPALHPRLSELSNAYIDDLNSHNFNYRPLPSDRKTFDQELEYLISLDAVERASISRVEEFEIFKGVESEDIERVAASCVREGKVALRSGWEQLVRTAQHSSRGTNKGEVHVLSVAWSALFITSCIKAALGTGNFDVNAVTVHANEIYPPRSGKLTGSAPDYGARILTAMDKLTVMYDVINNYKTSHPLAMPRTCYMGDSATDLACLMTANFGICIRDRVMSGEQKQLQQALQRIGMHMAPLNESNGAKGTRELCPESTLNVNQVVWSAHDFSEVIHNGLLK